MSSWSKPGSLSMYGVERRDPLAARVDRDLEVAHRRHVVLTGLAGELLADLVPDVVLRQHGEVDLDAGLLGEVRGGQLLQVDHLRVVDHEDVEAVRRPRRRRPSRRSRSRPAPRATEIAISRAVVARVASHCCLLERTECTYERAGVSSCKSSRRTGPGVNGLVPYWAADCSDEQGDAEHRMARNPAAGPAQMVLTASVARRYYLDGRSKIEIAEEFALSRFKVARLLETARASGLVRDRDQLPGRGRPRAVRPAAGAVRADALRRRGHAGRRHPLAAPAPRHRRGSAAHRDRHHRRRARAGLVPLGQRGRRGADRAGADPGRPADRGAVPRRTATTAPSTWSGTSPASPAARRTSSTPRSSCPTRPPPGRCAGSPRWPVRSRSSAGHQGDRRDRPVGRGAVHCVRRGDRAGTPGAAPAGRVRRGLRCVRHRRRRHPADGAERPDDRGQRRPAAGHRRGRRGAVRDGEGAGGAGRAAVPAGRQPGHAHLAGPGVAGDGHPDRPAGTAGVG